MEQEADARAEATFQTAPPDQTLQPAELPGGLQYDGAQMSFNAESALYKTQKNVGSAGFSEHRFAWANAQKQRQTFTLPVPAMANFAFSPMPIALDKPARLSWEGQPIGEDESLVLIWENAEHGTATMQVAGATMGKFIDFPAAELRKLKPGEWSVYLVRKRIVRQTVDGVVARGVSEFYSTAQKVQVK